MPDKVYWTGAREPLGIKPVKGEVYGYKFIGYLQAPSVREAKQYAVLHASDRNVSFPDKKPKYSDIEVRVTDIAPQ